MQILIDILFLSIFIVDPPKVTEHPKSQSMPTGGETTLKVEATGDDLKFQWQKNGRNLKNGSNYSETGTNTLSIRHVKKSHAGCYRCLVRNEVKLEGEISEEAELNVCECLSMSLCSLSIITCVCISSLLI